MAKWFSAIACSALLAVNALPSRAGEEPPEKRSSRNQSEKRNDEWKKLAPDEREAKLKEWRKTNGLPREEWEKRREQLKKMTPDEREAKRKELQQRLEKRIAELREKVTNATITPQEKRELERREKILKRFNQAAAETPRERPKREPAAPPPPEN